MRRNGAMKICFVSALVLTTLCVGCCSNMGGNLRAKAQRVDELNAGATDLTTLDVSTQVGAIKLESGDISRVDIVAEITVRSKTTEEAEALIEDVQIVAEQSGDKLVVKAVKPSGFGRNQLGVEFTITAPAGLALRCTTNVGDIRIAGFNESVVAKTDVGTIRCSDLRSNANLHTNVGDIKVSYASDAPAVFEASASTNVGNVDFTGPDDISAKLAARVNVGSINTDRPLTVTGPIKKSISATLGNAEGKITLHTNVGSVKIR
jgi:Toastrack DUF4097